MELGEKNINFKKILIFSALLFLLSVLVPTLILGQDRSEISIDKIETPKISQLNLAEIASAGQVTGSQEI